MYYLQDDISGQLTFVLCNSVINTVNKGVKYSSEAEGKMPMSRDAQAAVPEISILISALCSLYKNEPPRTSSVLRDLFVCMYTHGRSQRRLYEYPQKAAQSSQFNGDVVQTLEHKNQLT
jgi:hypothetical protein